MYSGLREKLIGEKTFEKGRLIDVLGEDEFVKGIRKLNPGEKYIFVYEDPERDCKINPKSFENCYFGRGSLYLKKEESEEESLKEEVIYFDKEMFLWQGSPLKGILDIVPVKSFKENRAKEDMKIYPFWNGSSYIKIIHVNPVEAWASAYKESEQGLWKNHLGKPEKIKPGIFSKHVNNSNNDW